jgi:hypothetical protein
MTNRKFIHFAVDFPAERKTTKQESSINWHLWKSRKEIFWKSPPQQKKKYKNCVTVNWKTWIFNRRQNSIKILQFKSIKIKKLRERHVIFIFIFRLLFIPQVSFLPNIFWILSHFQNKISYKTGSLCASSLFNLNFKDSSSIYKLGLSDVIRNKWGRFCILITRRGFQCKPTKSPINPQWQKKLQIQIRPPPTLRQCSKNWNFKLIYLIWQKIVLFIFSFFCISKKNEVILCKWNNQHII